MDSIAENVAATNDFSTFGPSADWEIAYHWAKKHGVLDPLVDLVDIALVDAAPTTFRKEVLGSLLKVVVRPTSRYLFAQWATHSIYAEGLSRLGEAVDQDGTILEDYPACGYEYPAKHFLKGQLEPLYLAAMCVARTPDPTADIQEHHVRWYETLVAWLLVSAHLAYHEKKIRLGSSLHRVCRRLRIAADDYRYAPVMLLFGIARPVDACRLLTQFEQTLAFRADSLCKQQKLEPEMYALLVAVAEIARHHHLEMELGSVAFSFPKRLGIDDGPSSADRKQAFADVRVPNDDEGSASKAASVLEGATTEESVTKILASEPTQAFQRLTGNSILLASTEELHFLPWSSTSPTEIEKKLLDRRVEELLASESISDQLLGAIISLAESTARSLRRALEVGIGSTPQTEWSWIPAEQKLVRHAPRRYSGWTPDNASQSEWILKENSTQSIWLSHRVQAVLSLALQRTPAARCLGDLWASVTKASPEIAFNKAITKVCPRLTPGMLGRALGVSLQTATRDATFTKLATSHPKSALPGACAYASWTSRQLHHALVAAGATLQDGVVDLPDDDSAMGSLLAVVEKFLPDAFERAAKRVNQLRDAIMASNHPLVLDELVEFHNRFVAYVVVQLLAATGARPVKDPFESPLDFCFRWHFVYAEDKAHVGALNGRLVPIPVELAEYIDTTYRAHLASIGRCLMHVNPALAEEIEKLVTNAHSHRIPFFFLLRQDKSGLNWESVSESSINDLKLFDWPLPLNFLRHRLANRLRELGVDAEIIDGLLGHGESGAETYGDESWRIWKTDADAASGAVAPAFAALKSRWPSGLPDSIAPVVLTRKPLAQALLPDASFGRTERASHRASRRAAWLRDAKADATFHRKQLLAGRKPEELSPEDLDEISRQLLLNTKGLPHALGWFKYQRFLDVLERHGQITKRRYRPKHYYIQHVSTTAFTELAPRSAKSFASLAAQLDEVLKETRPHSYQQAAFFACLLLCAQSRIADLVRLMAVLHGEGYRVLRLDGKYSIEFANDIRADDPDAAVRRHRISARAAGFLRLSQERTTKARVAAQAVPAALQDFADTLAGIVNVKLDDCHKVLRALVDLTDQWNGMTLPGVVSGYLAGRNESWSLPARSWAHQMLGFPLCFPEVEPAESEPGGGEPVGIKSLARASADAHVAAADNFLAEFRKAIRDYDEGRADEFAAITDEAEPADPARPSRRNLRRGLLRLIESRSGTVSPTLLLLAKWITTHVTRKNKGRYVAVSSLFRYLTALSRAFADTAFNVDIRLLQEDELTELYALIVSAGSHKRARYRYERLRAFQRWCEIHHDVVRPDWSELPCYDVAIAADAGIILESDYLASMSALIATSNEARRETLAPALLLFVCYRFGLRPREGIGIRRDEWLDLGPHILLIIQTNNIRRTKVPVAARRAVPLVFDLTPMERELLERWFGRLEAIAGARRDVPVFCDEAGELLDLDRTSARVRSVLKQVTGNPEVVLYHARHTAGTAVALALADLELPGSERLPGVASREWRQRVQILLLGYAGVSRRSPWALARYFGHTGTDRARASYLHFFGDWADALIWDGVSEKASERNVEGVLDLDALPRLDIDPVAQIASVEPLHFVPTIVGTLHFLRLLARGYSARQAGDRLGMPQHIVSEWALFVDTLDRRLYLAKEPIGLDEHLSARALSHVGEDGWQRLLSLAAPIVSEDVARKLEQRGVTSGEVRPVGLSMVGATRQWTPWTIEQLTLLRVLLDIWEISADQQRMVGRLEDIAGSEFQRAATSLGFNIRSVKGDSSEASVKIDAGMELKTEGKELHNFGKRCAFLFQEKNGRSVRNSFEWLVACIAVLLFVPTNAEIAARTAESAGGEVGKGL